MQNYELLRKHLQTKPSRYSREGETYLVGGSKVWGLVVLLEDDRGHKEQLGPTAAISPVLVTTTDGLHWTESSLAVETTHASWTRLNTELTRVLDIVRVQVVCHLARVHQGTDRCKQNV